MGLELLERQAVLQSPSRIEELVKIFIHATKVSSGALPLRLLCSRTGVLIQAADGNRLLGDVSLQLIVDIAGHQECVCNWMGNGRVALSNRYASSSGGDVLSNVRLSRLPQTACLADPRIQTLNPSMAYQCSMVDRIRAPRDRSSPATSLGCFKCDNKDIDNPQSP